MLEYFWSIYPKESNETKDVTEIASLLIYFKIWNDYLDIKSDSFWTDYNLSAIFS